MNLSDFDYALPKELIAQRPVDPRDSSRMMVVTRNPDINNLDTLEHRHFRDLPAYLKKGDVLVFNQSKVVPARILFEYRGRECEIFFLRVFDDGLWEVMVRPGKYFKIGVKIPYNGDVSFEIIDFARGNDHGHRIVRVHDFQKRSAFDLLDSIGSVPLPPYIESLDGVAHYQTVYAKTPGSVAAPTAGFHFTEQLLNTLQDIGVQIEYVTLHVGAGTFLPVSTEVISEHVMHDEYYEIDKSSFERIQGAKLDGRRIIAVGTTSCRTLESCFADPAYPILSGSTRLFIYPGYRFRCIDGLITNFHLPRSTLLMLVSAFAGYDNVKYAYREAVNLGYRFFSFGDGMLIL